MDLSHKILETFPNHKRSGNWINICCPFCAETGRTPDTKYHLGLNYKYGYTNCFRCETKHKLSYFLKINEIAFDESELDFDVSVPIVSKKLDIQFPAEFINILDMIDSPSRYEAALQYIENRIGLELAIKLNVGFCEIGAYANRILIPIFDTMDNIIYFIARAIYSFIVPKVKNPYGSKSSIMFNWNKAQTFSEIYIMEGIFGAVTVYPYGVATLGKKISEDQILAILRSNVKIINIVLDGNAITDAYELADRISDMTSKVKIRVLELKKECQPDDYDRQHIFRLKDTTPFYTPLFLKGSPWK